MHKNIFVTFLFIVLFLLSFSSCHAKTINFLIEESPYYVGQDFLVRKGDTLAIEPGVVVEIAKDISIIIEGKIDISGFSKGGEVIFKAVGPFHNYHKGFWNGIIIKSNEENIINYAVIQHSKTGLEVGENCSINISNNIITQNKTGIKAAKSRELAITRNSFLNNFIDIEIVDSKGLIEKNYFDGSLTCLILKEGYPLIQGNFFKQANKHIIKCHNEKELSAGKNFYSSADEEKIRILISQNGKGKFVFKPFLNEPPNLTE